MPFLPLYVEQLGRDGPQRAQYVVRSGIQHHVSVLRDCLALLGRPCRPQGRKIMLLRSALGMAIIMALMGVAQNVWQFLILRALLGLLGGFIPNANALIATQIPRHKSGWALGRSQPAA
jgi:DHA1 family multidrug resistance protein-like MFS transporter